jgi:uncharacterized protein YqeY
MNLTEQINADIKEAMKARETLRLETLRSIRAGILEFEKSGVEREMTPDDEFKILNSAAKKRKDSIEQFENAGRTEAAEKEKAELAIIMSYLPQQMSADEVRAAVQAIIAELGATGAGDFGKVMGAATKQLKGKADGSLIQAAAKELLA